MPEKNSSIIKIIDRAIFVFIIIFLLTISNSIFVNQIGYYGALLLILIKVAINKENQFSKTGLEFALLWYVVAELLSTIFSQNKSLSANNMLKHTLLIPIIYVMVAAVKDLITAKNIFKIYIAGTLVTVLIYLYFSFHFYINNLYGITESGPSIFQYPITASEIISFTVIYLFAFLINEKTSIKNKLFLLIAFLLSSLALFSTYKRTGWFGAAFGIFIVLIIKKQWKILIAGIIIFIMFFITQKNISEVNVYSLTKLSDKPVKTFKTSGKAYNAYGINDEIFVSDYNKGLLVYKDSSLVQHLELPSAAVKFFHWKDNYFLSYLIDTRYILFKKVNDELKEINQLYSPGFTVADAVVNGFLYILDKDSGLTVFTNPNNIKEKIIYPGLNSFTKFWVDSNSFLLADPFGAYSIFKIKNNLLELSSEKSGKINGDIVFYKNGNIFTLDKKGLSIYNLDSINIHYQQTIPEIKSVMQMIFKEGKYYISSLDGNVFVLEQSPDNLFVIVNKSDLHFIPKSISVSDKFILITEVENKQSRFLSIFDPYHPSNFNRLSLWNAGIKIFEQHPIFGVGDIDLAELYKRYKEPYHKEIQGHLHNNFFHILATLGLFGLLAVLFLFYKIIAIDLMIYKNLKDTAFLSSYALGTIAAFFGFIISGLTELNFWDHEIATLIWFTFGLNIAFYNTIKPENESN